MKKICIAFVLGLMITLVGNPVTAQDTLYGTLLPDNYYNPERPDTAFFDSLYVHFSLLMDGKKYGVIRYTDEPLKVYGIAASLMCPLDYWPPEQVECFAYDYEDTSRAALNDERLCIWEMYGDTVEQVGLLPFPISTMQPSYYWSWQVPLANNPDTTVQCVPMYEHYYPEPIIVQDSFIIGGLVSNGFFTNKDEGPTYQTWPVSIVSFLTFRMDEDGMPDLYGNPKNHISEFNTTGSRAIYDSIVTDSIVSWETIDTSYWRRNRVYNAGHVLLFPIITPNPDTVGGDDTTSAAIRPLSPVERNTVVTPNPASGMVQVASGFGINAIEVYDAAGSKVHEQRATGLAIQLDVSRWPRGTYLVRVHTTAGTATKRLVVQ